MRNGRALLFALVLLGAIAARAIAQGNAPAHPLVVGVIDIGVVFKRYQRKDDLEKQVNAQKEKLEKEAAAQRERVQSLRKQLELLKEGSPAWRAKKYELLTAMKAAEVAAQAAEDELKSQVEDLTLRLLEEIEGTVRDYGTKNGYDLIMKIDTKGWGDEKFQERIFRAQVSAVLFHTAKIDITESILALLNDPKHVQQMQMRATQPQPAGDPGKK